MFRRIYSLYWTEALTPGITWVAGSQRQSSQDQHFFKVTAVMALYYCLPWKRRQYWTIRKRWDFKLQKLNYRIEITNSCSVALVNIKGLIHPKMLSSFIHPQVVPNLIHNWRCFNEILQLSIPPLTLYTTTSLMHKDIVKLIHNWAVQFTFSERDMIALYVEQI